MTKPSNVCAAGNVVTLADWRARLPRKPASTRSTALSAAPIISLASATKRQRPEHLEFRLMSGEGPMLYSELKGLVMSIDCPTIERSYRIEWSMPDERLTVVYHWGNDCALSYEPVSEREHTELKEWLAANDDVTDRYNFERDLCAENEDPR